MRRALLLAGAWLLVAVPDAPAKCCALTTPPAPRDLAAGEEWVAQLELHGDPWPQDLDRLTVIAWSDTATKLVSVDSRRTRTPRVYLAHVVFPEPGVWRYTVAVGGFAGSTVGPLRQVTVAPRRREGPARLVLGSAVAATAALLLVSAYRRRARGV